MLPKPLAAVLGSSPRVWGQVNTLYAFPVILRIIPTRVGTSTDNPNDIIDTEDHPHACGDKRTLKHISKAVEGSSPRVWGQVLTAGPAKVQNRIIPTRVGTRIVIIAA